MTLTCAQFAPHIYNLIEGVYREGVHRHDVLLQSTMKRNFVRSLQLSDELGGVIFDQLTQRIKDAANPQGL